MKVFLCGYHWVGCRILKQLLERKYDVALFTHKPAMPHIPDIRRVAKYHDIWYTTKSVNKSEHPFAPDVVISVYYKFIIKKPVLDMAAGKSFNVHPSLLPKHRGCSSVPWAIIEGDDKTGVTFHYMDESIDTGRIILQKEVKIEKNEVQRSLFNKCMRIGSEFFLEALDAVLVGVRGDEQIGTPSYHKRGVPHSGIIDPNWGMEKIERFIRAMDYPPYAYATYNGKEIRTIQDYIKALGE